MAGFLFLGPRGGHSYGDGSGATISHLRFEIVGFPIFSLDTDDVTVGHCTLVSLGQGIVNNEGNGWNISHNVIDGLRTILDNRHNHYIGGIGITILCHGGFPKTAQNNLIAHNKTPI